MEFRIADTFQSSLGKLNAQEQKAVKTTAFDLQMGLSGNSTNSIKLNVLKIEISGQYELIMTFV